MKKGFCTPYHFMFHNLGIAGCLVEYRQTVEKGKKIQNKFLRGGARINQPSPFPFKWMTKTNVNM